MDIRQIQCFLCLYEEGSVTRAAAQLGIVQPALSMQIGRLEKEFNVKLFERSSRGVVPTAEGSNFYAMLLPIMRDIENVRHSMLDVSGRASGRVLIGVIPSLTSSIMPGLLRDYCVKHPDVAIQMAESYSATLVDQVESGSLDVALTNHPGRATGLVVTELVSEEMVLVTSRTAGLVPPGPVELRQIVRLNLVLPTGRQGIRGLIDRNLARLGLAVKPRLELDALVPTVELVRSGDWATILPLIAVYNQADEKGLQLNPLSGPGMRRELVAVHHPRRPLTLAAKSLCDSVVQELRRVIEEAEGTLRLADPAQPAARKARGRRSAAGSMKPADNGPR